VKLYRTARRQHSPEANGNYAKWKQLTGVRQPGHKPLNVEPEEFTLMWTRYQEAHNQDVEDILCAIENCRVQNLIDCYNYL
jgi:hypothetical protein